MTTKLLIPSKAPSLPIAPLEYNKGQQDQHSNVLRLYFTQVDNINAAVLGPLGGQYFNNPHISASDSTDQYADGNNDPTLVKFNTLGMNAGFVLNLDGSATCPTSGVYKIDYSLQFTNTDNAAHDVFVWLQTNGTVVADSSSRFTIPSRKSEGVYGYLVAYSSITFPIIGGDNIKLWWAVDQAYNPTGPVNGVYMEHIAEQTTPYVRPANPSAVGSITFVSSIE